MHNITSPRPAGTDEEVEKELVRKGLNAPRITLDTIEASIASAHYFTAAEGVYGATGQGTGIDRLDHVTLCVLVMKNGYVVTGESACTSPSNFDPAIGRSIARMDAERKIWSLLGYELRTKLSQA
jgi:hypothetical protein